MFVFVVHWCVCVKNGMTLLHWASRRGFLEESFTLLDRGADIDAKTSCVSNDITVFIFVDD